MKLPTEPYLCGKIRYRMVLGEVQIFIGSGFQRFFGVFFQSGALARKDSAHKEAKNSFDAKEIIFGHVLNNHDFHIIDIVNDQW